MKHISNSDIESLHITPKECVDWVTKSFKMKYEAQLPTKISLHPVGTSNFFNTMPCMLPDSYDRFGVKVVSRIAGQKPALHSDLLLYKTSTGELLSLMDADWITQMRTGAVAALAIRTLAIPNAKVYAFVGLGSVAEATMMCLQDILPQDARLEVKLMQYKDHAERFIEKFADKRIVYSVVSTHEELIRNSDVIVSCVTEMPELFCTDDSLFKPGVLVVPVHTRGFQNCDLFFDHVFADDEGHVSGFKYFPQFRAFNELSEVLLGRVPARRDVQERVLAYNIGLGLHDVYFASNIFNKLQA